MNLDLEYIQNVLIVLKAETFYFKNLIDDTLSPLGLSKHSMDSRIAAEMYLKPLFECILCFSYLLELRKDLKYSV